ncbi:MAG: hypothetical protein DRI36_01110 [Caldiserica bacterium]|nr:MAG: hypothetical protein DRI36_01110 [Caldisericota bacterium]
MIIFLIFAIYLLSYQEFLYEAKGDGTSGSFRIFHSDSRGIFYNPASLIYAKDAIFINYSPGYFEINELGIDFSSLSFSKKLSKNTFTIGYKNLDVSDIYLQRSLIIGYAREIFGIGFGISLKNIVKKYTLDLRTKNDPVFEKSNERSVFSFDIGILKEYKRVVVSAFILDANRPDVGLKKTEKILQKSGVFFGRRFGNLLVEIGVLKSENIRFKFGAEMSRELEGLKFYLRTGGDISRISFGFGFEFKKAIFDFAFQYPFEFGKILYEIEAGVRF